MNTLLLKSTWCAALCCAALSSAAAEYIYSPKSKQLTQKDGILSNVSKKNAGFKLSQTIPVNSRMELKIKFPVKGSFALYTGRGKEAFILNRDGEIFTWTHRSINGALPQYRPYPGSTDTNVRLYWWENTRYSPNGRFTQNFSLTPLDLAWTALLRNKFFKDLNSEYLPLAIEIENGRIRYYFDNILFQEQEVTEDIHSHIFYFNISAGVEVTRPVVSSLDPVDPFFTPINISGKFNAKGEHQLQRSKRIVFNGIPFELYQGNKFGDCVDLSQSWFREGALLANNSEPHRGAFGGRWGGVFGGSRTRMQFRVANRNYNCIYLLASSETGTGKGSDLSAQFYRPGSGLSVDFPHREQLITDGSLRVIKIPVTADLLQNFADREVIELELTGKLHTYKGFPDPLNYSVHGAGLPPGVKVYAMTLGISQQDVKFTPEAKGNVWTESTPAYTVTITNLTDKAKEYALKFTGYSFDKTPIAPQNFKVTVAPRATWKRRFTFNTKYGWSRIDLDVNGEKYYHTLARLRRRNQKPRDFFQKGHFFGIWPGGGVHFDVGFYDSIYFASQLGIKSLGIAAWNLNRDSVAKLVKTYGLRNYHSTSINSRHVNRPDIEKILEANRLKPSAINQPVFQYVFAEPGGIGTRFRQEFCGEEKYVRTPKEQERFDEYKKSIISFGKAFRRLFPGQKLLVPWGDSNFCASYVEDPETRPFVDGFGLDIGYFDRLPEQQFHQCSIHRLYQFYQVWKQYKKEPPLIVGCEGPCVTGSKPGALTETQHAAHVMRIALLLSAYGVRHQLSNIAGAPQNSSYWADQHYSGGGMTRFSHNPFPVYSACGTLIRHLMDAEFIKWIPTGSLATYCLQYRNVLTKQHFLVMWTVNGTRSVTVKGKVKSAFDAMDNNIRKLQIGQLPIFVYTESEKVSFGKPVYPDNKPAAVRIKLANAGELFTKQTSEAAKEYLDGFATDVRRYPATMVLTKKGSALDVTLPKQKIDRGFMPYYTTLLPAKKVIIPGKAKAITIEVTAASDWGRIVYVLRDAKGEIWTSSGFQYSWNCDDTPNHSFFNFDGKKLVRISLPANLEWDNFREEGTATWGYVGGDGVVDYPLTLEKVYLERRHKAMYVNSLEPAASPTVTLGAIHAEYENKAMTAYKVTQSRPLPAGTVASFNPIEKLAKSAKLPASAITKVNEPEHYYDGTRGVFFFNEMPNAVRYEIYLSRHADGTNALCLHRNIKKSGTQVNGFLAETDFYAFVVYYDKAGNNSIPSKPFKLNMKDNFGNK